MGKEPQLAESSFKKSSIHLHILISPWNPRTQRKSRRYPQNSCCCDIVVTVDTSKLLPTEQTGNQIRRMCEGLSYLCCAKVIAFFVVPSHVRHIQGCWWICHGVNSLKRGRVLLMLAKRNSLKKQTAQFFFVRV